MRLLVLGPFRAFDDGAPLPLGPPKQRLLAAVLLCRRGDIVTSAELIDALWGAAPPASAGGNLRSYVHGLRRVLGVDRLTGHGRSGYRLDVPAGAVDATEFVEAAARGEVALAAGDTATARALLHDALGLWRDRPFADLPDVPVLAREAARLGEYRLLALEHRVEADLRSGSAAEIVAELRDLVTAHPYRERFQLQLMLALYRAGRTADALAWGRDAMARMRRDLGVEPSDELRALEVAILRRERRLDPPGEREPPGDGAGPVPAELPSAPGHFTGRGAELRTLTELATRQARAAGVPVIAVVGTAGVGKTALAVSWGHRAARRFPDGQLYLDLHGFHDGPAVTPYDGVSRLLRSLGVDPDRIPASLDEASAMFRSRIAGRRILIVLDNAPSAELVRPMVPGSPGCLVLVTSRDRLTGLLARDGAQVLALQPLPPAGAVGLIRRVLGGDRGAAEPAALTRLAEACGCLPLALRIAAANLAERPDRTIADHVADLSAGNRLDRLAVDGDGSLAVRQAFDLSYRALDPPVRRCFRLLGSMPGRDAGVPSVAAMLGVSAAETSRSLDRLAGAHLAHRDDHGRFRLHDLVREFARERALAEDPADREAALGDLLEFCAATAYAAAQVLYPQMARLPPADDRGAVVAAFADAADAAAWVNAELPNLAAAVLHAAEHGPRQAAWVIAGALRGTFWHSRATAEWTVVAEAAERAADAEGDAAARAAAQLSLATVAMVRRDYPEARRRHVRVLALSRLARWREGEATALANLAAVYGEMGKLDPSVAYFRRALAVNRQIGWRPGIAVTLCNIGQTLAFLGRLPEAVEHFERALRVYEELGASGGQAVALTNLAEIQRLQDQLGDARDSIRRARLIARDVGRVDTEAHALIQSAAICREAGSPAESLRHARAALELTARVGDRLLSAYAHEEVAKARLATGDVDGARSSFETARGLAAEIGNRYLETAMRVESAMAAGRADREAAVQDTTDALAVAREHGYALLEGRAYAVLTELAGDPAGSARAAVAIQDRTGWRLGRARLLEVIRAGGR
ncbi:DNA-binding SARP family transcriptional activator/Tfp pilus assembly protein PilF [Catenuloplanes nepalensis]|uniref:DNA-binding SARP family transcriptional activator/Tfp pilus assembly protein PilF n=1 Tax=Catenuloplanes nepalensis TaxID=587533 RepID=A0ABT9N4S5_9ACTN|nr:BTAD domain-containing putative transcriptional regulator [Catenuloplanes nepalensis]MDP9798692.1 DNA-binding SARP family transcriptional activator/Tfp pilus assembly protein PilF [Catenuloplanes nepalensis]